ncbi:MAG: hypothetical protein QM808_17115 [Steroidobacteraceae bacterium]
MLLIALLHEQAQAQLGAATADEAKLGRPSARVAISDTTPPPADPRDFTGIWRGPRNARQIAGPAPAATPAPAAPAATEGGARPSSRYCIPGVLLLHSVEGDTEFLQSADELRIMVDPHHSNRRIYINQQHTRPLVRSLNGDSIAHWEGNTLVVETTGFTGYGVSPTLVRTERLHKSADNLSLIADISYSDSSGRTKPADTNITLTWAPGSRILEYICEDESEEYMTGEYGK